MSNLILHCGGRQATRDEVRAVPVPEETDTWKPVSYDAAIELLYSAVAEKLDLPIRSEAYGLNKAGDQLFALMTLETGDDETGLSIGLRRREAPHEEGQAPEVVMKRELYVPGHHVPGHSVLLDDPSGVIRLRARKGREEHEHRNIRKAP